METRKNYFVLKRQFLNFTPPCEMYDCVNLTRCKQGMACASFRDFASLGIVMMPSKPSKKMYEWIYNG